MQWLRRSSGVREATITDDRGPGAHPPDNPADASSSRAASNGAGWLPNPRHGVPVNEDMTGSPTGDPGGPLDRASEARHELISSLARNITARHDLADVLATTLSELRGLLRWSGASIQLVDDDGWIRLAAAEPMAATETYDIRIPLHSTVPGRIVLTERPLYLPDVSASMESGAVARGNFTTTDARSYLGVPLLADGRAIGVLQLDSSDADAWDATERMLVVCVAPVVAAAIQNARSHALVTAVNATNRRIIERWRAISRLLTSDVDTSVRGLVELAEYIPSMREEVDRLTVAIAQVRAVAADNERGDAADVSVDLRAPEKTGR